MEAAGVRVRVVEPAPPRNFHDRIRWTFIPLLLAIGAYTLLFGVRAAGYHALEAGVAAGEIETISATPGIEGMAEGSTVQEVRWSQGGRHYRTEVRMITPTTADDHVASDDLPALWGHDVAGTLRTTNPDLRVERAVGESELYSEVLGYRLPAWVGWALVAIGIGSLSMLISGREPWRATRWAWFWIMLSPIGLLIYLVLSGPTPLIPAPRKPARRLTGGWAFLLSLLLPIR